MTLHDVGLLAGFLFPGLLLSIIILFTFSKGG